MSPMIQRLKALKIIPVIAIENAQQVIPFAKMLIEHGFVATEIDGCCELSIDAIKLLRERLPEMLIGVGGLSTLQQVLSIKQAGAHFIVSTAPNPQLVKFCQTAALPLVISLNQPSMIEVSREKGLTTLEYYPAEGIENGISQALLFAPDVSVTQQQTDEAPDILQIPRVICHFDDCEVERLIEARGLGDKMLQLINQSNSTTEHSRYFLW
ncbi:MULTISPECIES: bifunctional 4-hydroxy-2-oxoglutarate aldolase/2-dehydro-3-deoxy-phosphogluconate aldolase [unclassified Agarivorans]|uniref:bifunctional 4-hydroxy-2-oxoglutarate aldolase/2-dehydro-3-deoxy-phosphogluconate aldolase n=1 Tax=unclassified Agarivorans TaxID=2636026 RepID=UPI003D7D9E8D